MDWLSQCSQRKGVFEYENCEMNLTTSLICIKK